MRWFFILMLALSSQAARADMCQLLGDQAALFAQWRDAGKSHAETVKYIKDKFDGSFQGMYLAIAGDVYADSKTLRPGVVRNMVVNECRAAGN